MTTAEQPMEASFSTLALSIASSAAMSMGLAPDPGTGKTEKNMGMAKFNIDLLMLLKAKTNGNLDDEEAKFLDSLISDLQVKFVDANK